GLAGRAIEPRDFAAVNDVGIQRIGSYISVLFNAHRMPFAKADLTEVAAASCAYAAAFLLPAVHPVGKLMVSDHMIELRSRLVVPRAPGPAAIHTDGGSLIHVQGNNLRAIRIDPYCVIVVATRRTFDRSEGNAGIGRAVRGDVGDVNCVFVLGI